MGTDTEHHVVIDDDKVSQQKQGTEDHTYSTKLTTHQKYTLLFAATSIGLLLISIIALGMVIIGLPRQGGVCFNISESLRTGIRLEVATDPIYFNLCGMQNCTFDFEQCSNECPLGYISDLRGCPVSCTCGQTGYFQGDIQFASNDLSQLMLMISETSATSIDAFNLLDDNNENFRIRTWGYADRAVVPYEIDPTFDSGTKAAITTVLSSIQSKTCVRFIIRTNEINYIHIYPSEVCSSRVGRRPGENIMLLNKDYCIGTASIQHLFMHALGFYHEQSRPDRDNYVTIHWDNVRRSEKHKLAKFNDLYSLNYGVAYNGKSLLHFPNQAFAINPNLPTITGKNGVSVRGEDPADLYKGMNESDILKINSLYRCKGYEYVFEAAQWGEWSAWSSSAKIHPACIRKRSCFRNGGNTSGVCLTRNSVSAKFELASIDTCDQAAQVKLQNTTNRRERIQGRMEPGNPATPSRISRRVCANGKLLVGFFNGDSMSDLLCLYGDGFMRIYQAENKGFYNRLSWEGQTPFCKYDPQANVIPADINGDGYTDLVCHRSTGLIEVIILKSGIFQEFLDWSGTIPECFGGSKQIFIADVNGDRKGDLICGNKQGFQLENIFLNRYQPEI